MIAVLRYSFLALVVAALAACSTMGNRRSTAQAPYQNQSGLASKATSVLQQQMTQPPQKRIPRELVADAKCIAVFPSVVQAGFIIGGHRGKGLVSCRQSSGGWSHAAPAVYTLSGGSLGLQAGVQKSSVILLFETRDSVSTLLQDKFKLGAGAGITAGPIGFDTHLASGPPAPVLSYVTSKKGLYAGVNLNGSWMSFDHAANTDLYGQEADKRSLLLGSHTVPSGMESFNRSLQSFAPNH